MNAIEAINKAISIFLQNGNLEDEDLLETFVEAGFAPDTARKIIIFMPLAFGRTIINNLGVLTSDVFDVCEIKDSTLHKQRRNLNDVEIYRESIKIAAEMVKKQDEKFWAVAGRSAELNAVNQMKTQGGNSQNIVLTPMATMWEIDEELPQNRTETTQANSVESAKTKSWWEFWK